MAAYLEPVKEARKQLKTLSSLLKEAQKGP